VVRAMPCPPLICIVDDDSVLRDAVADLIRARGFRTALFPTADAFLASEEKLSCLCVLADVQMPGTSGVEIKPALMAAGLSTPVIVTTALAGDYWSDRAVETGAAFLRKPFGADALLRLVARSLDV
jgi:FixJ family two-component response regulator